MITGCLKWSVGMTVARVEQHCNVCLYFLYFIYSSSISPSPLFRFFSFSNLVVTMSSEVPESSTIPVTPSHPLVTANDHTSLLNVVGWFAVTVIVLIVLTRLGTRQAKSRTVGSDDAAIIISTVSAFSLKPSHFVSRSGRITNRLVSSHGADSRYVHGCEEWLGSAHGR
jgi:hypothetical protein